MGKSAIILLFVLVLASFCEAAFTDYMVLSWNSTMKQVLSGLDSSDLNGDSQAETLAATSLEGAIYAFDSNGEQVWKYNTRGYVYDVLVSDLNGDYYKEVITGTSGHIYVIDHKGELDFSFKTSRNEVRNFVTGDINGDGKKEIIVGAFATSCQKNIILVINSSGNKVWTYPLGSYYGNVVGTGDLDGDGSDEVIVGTRLRATDSSRMLCEPSKTSAAKVVAINGSGDKLWEYATEGGATVVSVSDLDGDGKSEVILGSYPRLYVIGHDGKLIWSYKTITRVDSLATGDLNGDGQKEVVIGANNVYVFDNMGNTLWYGATNDRVYNVKIVDLDNDGFAEVVAGSDKVYVFDNEGELLWNSPALIAVHKLSVTDLEGDGLKEIVVGAVKEILVYKTGSNARRQYADEYYIKAKDDQTGQRYESAYDNAMQARSMYSRLGLMSDVGKAIELIDRINKSLARIGGEIKDAETYLSLSKKAYDVQDFWNASNYALIAKNKYASLEVSDDNAIKDADGIINVSNAVLIENASSYYELAVQLSAEGDFEGALVPAKKAYDIFKYLRDFENIDKSNKLVSELNAKSKPGFDLGKLVGGLKLPKLKIGGFTIIIVVVFTLIFGFAIIAIFLVRRAKRRKPTLSDEEVKKHLDEAKIEQERKPESEKPRPKVVCEREKFTKDGRRGAGCVIPKGR